MVEDIDKESTPLNTPPFYTHQNLNNIDAEISLQYTDSFSENVFKVLPIILIPKKGGLI